MRRKRSRVPTPRLAAEFGGRFHELSVSDAVAQANVHGRALSVELRKECKWE